MYASQLKALSDPNRMLIMKKLATNEHCRCDANCACRLLESFDFSQPTLSHHMKTLCSSGLVAAKRDGSRTHYQINRDVYEELLAYLRESITPGICECDNN